MVSFLLSVTFACGVVIAVAHVMNRRFIAPVYDVVANLTAFGCAAGASILLGHPVPAILCGAAILCWLFLARYGRCLTAENHMTEGLRLPEVPHYRR